MICADFFGYKNSVQNCNFYTKYIYEFPCTSSPNTDISLFYYTKLVFAKPVAKRSHLWTVVFFFTKVYRKVKPEKVFQIKTVQYLPSINILTHEGRTSDL